MRRVLLGIALVAGGLLALSLHAPGPRWSVAAAPAPLGRMAAMDGDRLLTMPQAADARSGAMTWCGPLEVRDLATGALVRSAWGEADSFHTFAFSPGGRFAVGITGWMLRWADNRTGEKRELPLPEGDAYPELRFSPDGGTLLVPRQAKGEASGEVLVVDLPTGQIVHRIPDAGNNLYVQAGGGRLVYPDPADVPALAVWDIAARKPLGRIEGGPNCRLSADGRTLLADGPEGRVEVWGLDDPSRPRRRGHVTATHDHDLALTPDGATAVVVPSGPLGGTLIVLDGRTGAKTWELPLLESLPPAHLTDNGRWLIFTGGQGPFGILLPHTDFRWGCNPLGLGVRGNSRVIDLVGRREAWADAASRVTDVAPGGGHLVVIGVDEMPQLLDMEAGHVRPLPLPASNAYIPAEARAAGGLLWLQTGQDIQPPSWWESWLPEAFRPAPAGLYRLDAFEPATGRAVFHHSRHGLMGHLPMPDGSGVVTFHAGESAWWVQRQDLQTTPLWPRAVGVLLLLGGVCVLMAAWRGKRPAATEAAILTT